MEQLFNNAACFTDIHFGNKNNNRQYNIDCEDFINWFIEESKLRKCETCIFLGDWHHHRSNINATTLNYSVKNMGTLSESFDTVYMITGNHDLYYRDGREIHSIPYAEIYKNIKVINETTFTDGNVSLVPWLVGDEWKNMKNIKSRYVFGHFELPSFIVHGSVVMPDHGTLKTSDFKQSEYVFSGHFHSRQFQSKCHYIGAPFGHNYGDAYDFERGAMFLKWGDRPEYKNYESGPRYVVTTLSDVKKNPEGYLDDKTYCRMMLDVDITYEEAIEIKKDMTSRFNPREICIIPKPMNNLIKKDDDSQESLRDIASVDEVIYTELNALESPTLDNKFLTDIYNSL